MAGTYARPNAELGDHRAATAGCEPRRSTLVVLAAAATPCTIHAMTDIIADSDHPVFNGLSPTWREELQWLHDRAEHLGLTATDLEDTYLGLLQDVAFDTVASERQGTTYEFGDFQAEVYRVRDELAQQMSRFLHR